MIRCPACGHEITDWTTVSGTMSSEAREVYEDAVRALRAEGLELNDNRRVAVGEVIEALAASYLASAHEHGH